MHAGNGLPATTTGRLRREPRRLVLHALIDPGRRRLVRRRVSPVAGAAPPPGSRQWTRRPQGQPQGGFPSRFGPGRWVWCCTPARVCRPPVPDGGGASQRRLLMSWSSTRCNSHAFPLLDGRRLVPLASRVSHPAPPPVLLRGSPMACEAFSSPSVLMTGETTSTLCCRYLQMYVLLLFTFCCR